MKIDITVRTRDRTLLAIHDFHLRENSITFLFGESGIGKSLLARALYGLLDSEDLEVVINDQPYDNYLRSNVCRQIQKNGFFVFQEPSSHLNPVMKIRDQLNEGDLTLKGNPDHVLKALYPDRSDEQIDDLIKIYPQPYRPSGGEKQRILLAMALKKMAIAAGETSGIFIFDEPTGSLDNHNRDIFLDLLLRQFTGTPKTILFISHDYSIISRLNKNIPNQKQKITYMELTCTSQVHRVERFSGQVYMNWTEGIKPAETVSKNKSLLSIKSGFEIFNRRFHFSTQSESTAKQTLQLYPRQMIYLKAGSGIGKTTLAKIITGLYRARKLDMNISGIKINEKTGHHIWSKHIWAKKVGMIFQHADEALNLNAKVKDVFAGLPRAKRPDTQYLHQELRYFYEDKIPDDFLQQKIKYLSGGQKQRLNIMRTFFLDTDIIILDEPLNGLDFSSMIKIINVLLEKSKEEKGFLLISHNEDIFDRLIPESSRFYLWSEAVDGG